MWAQKLCLKSKTLWDTWQGKQFTRTQTDWQTTLWTRPGNRTRCHFTARVRRCVVFNLSIGTICQALRALLCLRNEETRQYCWKCFECLVVFQGIFLTFRFDTALQDEYFTNIHFRDLVLQLGNLYSIIRKKLYQPPQSQSAPKKQERVRLFWVRKDDLLKVFCIS